MNIYTITLNPAYDIHAYAKQFAPFCENLVKILTRNAGGKGINITRALNAVGISSTAVVVLGRENCADFKAELLQDGIDSIIFERQGSIRNNITIHTDNSPETRISFSGSSLDGGILSEIENKLELDSQTIVSFTGRVPEGISAEQVTQFLSLLKKRGAKLVIDSKSLLLSDIYSIKPWLIKPNEEEISAYFKCEVDSIEKAEEKAMEISKQGIENVMVSLGDKGALLIADGKVYKAIPPKITSVSTIGAGDSAIAGFISAYIEGAAPLERLKTAVSFGTAACLTEGTAPPNKTEIKMLLKRISVQS